MNPFCAAFHIFCAAAAEEAAPMTKAIPPIGTAVAQPVVPYQRDIQSAAEFFFGVPAPSPTIAAQIAQESNFNPNARSTVGALGLLQFMPATAEWASKTGGFGIAAPLDPAWSIRAGTWYDRYLYDRVKMANTPCDRWLFALSGYNGGEKWRALRQAASRDPGSWAMTGSINPGISEASQRENSQYGPRIVYVLQPKFSALGYNICKGGTT